MCGIAGIYAYSGPYNGHATLTEMLDKMVAAQVHRGPDDSGTLVRERFAMGMRRLSIIDVASGHQPISNEDDTAWIVYNGEVYNYLDLQAHLVGHHQFKTRSDTEVILHLYEEHDSRCVDYLNGMFAFAIWDEERDRLFIARDRLGIKPLFYAERGGVFYFASEIPALLKALGSCPQINRTALDLYLSLGYIPSPYTIFEGIAKLPAGFHLTVDRNGCRLQQYWRLKYEPRPERDEQFYVETIRERLRESVRLRLQSEVPLGAFLSGGLDSTSIVALMSELGTEPVKTFSVGFAETSFSELDEARLVAERYCTDHHELLVTPDMVPETLERCLWHMGEPCGAWSLVLNDLVAQLARRKVTVVLAGHGGDEAFAGYPTLTAHKVLCLYQRIPKPARQFMQRVVERLPVSDANMALDYKARLFMRGTEMPYAEAFLAWKQIFTRAQRRMLLPGYWENGRQPDIATALYTTYAQEVEALDWVSRLLHVDTKVFLEGSVLAIADRTSMAHSLEARVPFLDHTLIEFAASIPADLKHKGFTTKYILREAIEPWLPRPLLRHGKSGFVLPEARWLRGPLQEYMRETLNELKKWEYMRGEDNKLIDGLVQEHVSGQANYGRQLTTLISLAIWLRLFNQ